MKIDFDIKKTIREAFKAGNRQRKKESVGNTVSIDYEIDNINSIMDDLCRKYPKVVSRDNLSGRATGNNILLVKDRDAGDSALLIFGQPKTEKPHVLITSFRKWRSLSHHCPHEEAVKSADVICRKLIDMGTGGDSILTASRGTCSFYLTPEGLARLYRYVESCDNLITNEAFRAGNRARRKESVQDTVESVDKLQQQIDRFRELTGYELEIRDGRPYYGNYIDLEDCTDLTELPDGLTVKNYLCINGCTGLTKLPDNMSVGADFYLNDCVNLTSLPHGLTVKGSMYLKNCNGLTSFPADLTVRGFSIYRIPESLFPFFRSIGIEVHFIGGIHSIDARDWMERRHTVNEAFKAGNRARKKESVQDAVSDIHEDEPVTDADVAADFLRDLNKRFPGVTRFKDDRYDSTYVEFAVWDVNHQDTMWFSFWRDSANLAADSCLDPAVTLMIWSEAVVKGVRVHWSGPDDKEAIRENYVKMLKESGLPIDMADVEAHRKPRLRLTSSSLARLASYVAKQADMQIMAPLGKAFQLEEAFKAGNKARKKESVQDTVKSVDSYFNSESIDELDSFIQTVWKSVCGDTEINAPYMDNDHYDNEAGLWWGPLKFSEFGHPELGNIKYRICFLKTADIQAFNKAFNKAQNSNDEFGQECPAKWTFDMHVQIGNEMASVRFYKIEPYSRYSNTNVVTYPVGVPQLTEAFSVLRLIYSRGIHTREHEAGWSTPGKQGSYFYACNRFSIQTWRNHVLPLDDSEQLRKYFLDTARAVYFRECDRSVDEAFKAGNQARKKESVQDAVDAIQPKELYVPDRDETAKTVLEKASPVIESLFNRNGFGIEKKSTYLHPKEALWTINVDGSPREHISVAYVTRGFAGWVMFLKTGFTVIKCLDITNPEWLGFLTDLSNKPDMFRLYFWMTGDGGATQKLHDLKYKYFERCKPVYGSAVNMEEFYNAMFLAVLDHYGAGLPDCCKFAETVTPVDMIRKGQTYTEIKEFISTLDVNNLDEAFKTGNRARKKEAIQDTVQVDKELTDEDIDRIMDDLCEKYPEVVHRKQFYHAFNDDVLEIYDGDADDNTILVFERPSEKDDGIIRVLVSSYRSVYMQGSEEQIDKSYEIIRSRLINDNVDPNTVTVNDEDYVLFDLTPENIAAIYRYTELCNSLTEAFRAGNRARKKESLQDTVEKVDGIPYPEDPEDPSLVAKCLLEITETALGRRDLADMIEIEHSFLNYDSDKDIVATIDTTINGAQLIVLVRKFTNQRNDIVVRPYSGVCIGGVMSSGHGGPRDIGPVDPDMLPAFKTGTTEVNFWPVGDIACWKSVISKYREDIKAVVAEVNSK